MNNILKTHFIGYFFMTFITIILFILNIIIFYYFGFNFYLNISSVIFWQIFIVILYYHFCLYQSNFLIFMQEKLVIPVKKGFLKNEIINLNISDIFEIKFVKKGFLGDFFGYGEIQFITNNNILKLNFCQNHKEIIDIIKNNKNK